MPVCVDSNLEQWCIDSVCITPLPLRPTRDCSNSPLDLFEPVNVLHCFIKHAIITYTFCLFPRCWHLKNSASRHLQAGNGARRYLSLDETLRKNACWQDSLWIIQASFDCGRRYQELSDSRCQEHTLLCDFILYIWRANHHRHIQSWGPSRKRIIHHCSHFLIFALAIFVVLYFQEVGTDFIIC